MYNNPLKAGTVGSGAGYTSVKLRLLNEKNNTRKPSSLHKKLMATINAKKNQIVEEIFGAKMYQEQKDAYLSKKQEPVQRARDSYPQTFLNTSEVPLVHYPRVQSPLSDEPRQQSRADLIKEKYESRHPLELLENLSDDERYRLRQAFEMKEEMDERRASLIQAAPKINVIDMMLEDN